MLDTKKEYDLKAAQKALGQVQDLLRQVSDTYRKLSKCVPIDQNFLSSESGLDQFFADAVSGLSPKLKSEIFAKANPAALALLNDGEQPLAKRLKALFSEAIQNLASYPVYSRKNNTLNTVTDAFQTMLIVEVGAQAIRTNLEILSNGENDRIQSLLDNLKKLSEGIDLNKPEIVGALSMQKDLVEFHQQDAIRHLERDTQISYIAPLLP